MHALEKMVQIYNMIVQLGFDATQLSLKAQSKLKTMYLSKRWSTKWNVLNRLKEASYSLSKYINSVSIKIVKILKKIKELDITIEKIITIKLINGLGSLFEIYLTILSQKAKNNNKLLNLQAVFSNLEDKKHYMKHTTKVTLLSHKVLVRRYFIQKWL